MPFSHDDLMFLAETLAAAGRDEVMPRFRRLGLGDVRQKTSVFDPVTEADEAAERAISSALRSRFPDALMVGEEATSADPTLLGQLGEARLAFTIDPIDGTRNFVAGLPLFGVMAAAIEAGEIVGSAIHDPVCGDVALALKGQGAWLLRDGQRIRMRVAEPRSLEKMEAIAGTQYLPEPLRARALANLPRLGSSAWLRCSAHEYRTAAGGFCHILFYNRLMPWDHAPGWLLHQEAGGYSARFDGSPYTPRQNTGGLICAPDRASWLLVRDALVGPGLEPH